MTDQFPDATKMVLSPAAQAVLDAYGDFEAANTDAMAAALRASAAHLIQEKGWSLGVRWSADELQSLATQLESTT
jgi:hypothetical protein